MGKLDSKWGLPFDTEEEVVDYIFEYVDTSKWEDSVIPVSAFGNEPNECFKETVEDKKELLREFFMSLCHKDEKKKEEDPEESFTAVALRLLTNQAAIMLSEKEHAREDVRAVLASELTDTSSLISAIVQHIEDSK